MTIFKITHEQMVEMMNGHEPPTNQDQADGYFKVFKTRVLEKYGQEQVTALYLLGGIAPDCFHEWVASRRPI